MLVPDYDEFNIYTTIEDVNSYVQMLFKEGIHKEEIIYEKCLEYFGEFSKELIDEFFEYED